VTIKKFPYAPRPAVKP